MEVDINKFKNLLIEGSKEFSVELCGNKTDKFLKYMEMLKDWNTKINLTAITEDEEIIIKHFIDSISVIPFIESTDSKIIDIGTGAGFPGIPIKIVLQNTKVTLLDSLNKRINYLNDVIQKLNLVDIESIHGRAEEYGVKKEFREKFDIAIARAVASLPTLLEYCLPFVKVGGVFIAMKGTCDEEIESSKKALETLGGKIEDIKKFNLPSTDINRNIIIVRKFRQTPIKFPRKSGKPSKEPLI